MIDKDGQPTTDPNDLFGGGSLLPFGEYKGYGLGILIELLGGVLTGYGCAYKPDYREGNGSFMLAMDIDRFLPLETFREESDNLLRHIKTNPPAPGTEEVLIPGELEFRTREARERDGIPVPDVIWDKVTAVAEELGVSGH